MKVECRKLLTEITTAVIVTVVVILLAITSVEGASTPADITASVAREQGINKLDDLSFGRFIISSASDAWVRILPDPDSSSNRISGDSIILTGGNWRPALLEVTGQQNQTFTIDLPGAVTITHVDYQQTQPNRHKMTVSEFTNSLAAEERFLDETGRKELYVGAYLDDIHPQQYEGRYVGEFTVTVHFD